jgi:hypothetical protein
MAVGGEHGRQRRQADAAVRAADGQHGDPRWAARPGERQQPGDLVGVHAQGPDGDAVAAPLPGQGAGGELPAAGGHGEVHGVRPGRRRDIERLLRVAIRRVHRPEQAHAVDALVGA